MNNKLQHILKKNKISDLCQQEYDNTYSAYKKIYQ